MMEEHGRFGRWSRDIEAELGLRPRYHGAHRSIDGWYRDNFRVPTTGGHRA